MNNSASGLVMLCFTCVTPLLIGILLGAHFARRRLDRGSWLRALLPAWVIKYLEQYHE